MTQTYTLTPNDVVRYLYNETSEQEAAFIADALLQDSELLKFYLDSLDVKLGLDKVTLSPPDRTIQFILAYSQQYLPECF